MQGRNEVRWRLGRVTSLAPPCSNLRSFRKQMYCFETSAYDIVVTFWPPAMIWRPGDCAPLLLSLRLWCYSIKIRKFSENKQIFKFERHELLFRVHLQFSNTIAYRMYRAQTVNKGYWRHFKFLRVVFVPLQILPHAFFRRGPVLFC